MILNTSFRTDIPAYYSEWFFNRIHAGYVLVRNPYNAAQISKYYLDPKLVDIICFCTKNPKPMLPRLGELSKFHQFWFVTITSYGKEIEPNVPEKKLVIESVRQLSTLIGAQAVGWRYDPIFITSQYSLDFHIQAFESFAAALCGYVHSCVISFIDLYEKTRHNFSSAKAVTAIEQEILVKEFVEIGSRYGICIRTCCENPDLAKLGADVSGCMTQPILEAACNCTLSIPKSIKSPRSECQCLLGLILECTIPVHMDVYIAMPIIIEQLLKKICEYTIRNLLC